VQAVLERRSDASTVLNGLQDAMAEVVALGHGVYPPALVRGDLPAALRELADQCPASTSVEVAGMLDGIPERLREATWFVCSEALANVARHASASRVSMRAGADDRLLEVEVRDDGRGGASAQRGLRGLKDRVEALGGTLTLDSPAGGPTVVRAAFPLSTQGLPRERSPEVQGAPR
jgi:signal transduction histidine kinase